MLPRLYYFFCAIPAMKWLTYLWYSCRRPALLISRKCWNNEVLSNHSSLCRKTKNHSCSTFKIMANIQKESEAQTAPRSLPGAEAAWLAKGTSSLGVSACVCVYLNLLLFSPNYDREARIQWQWRPCNLGERKMQVGERDLICTSSGCCRWGNHDVSWCVIRLQRAGTADSPRDLPPVSTYRRWQGRSL